MPALATVLSVLALLASVPAAAQTSLEPSRSMGGRQLLLSADTPGQVQEVRIGPDTTTNLLFDAPIQFGEVEEREHFRRVVVAEDALMLMPSRELMGKRLRMPVRFADGGAPASVEFVLVVVPPEQAEHQVEVYRPRAPELCQQEAREEREKARQCETELVRERAKPKGLGGLTGLLAQEQMDDEGVVARRLMRITQQPREALQWRKVTSYRATRPQQEGEKKPKVVRVAVELWVAHQDPRSWTAAGAELVSGNGTRWRVAVWQQGPIHPGKKGQRVVVEKEMTEAEARGAFTLALWEEGGARPVTLGGVSFP